jgi:hypothetical protein
VSSIAEEVAKRDITEILHFTTNHGLTGSLGEGSVLSRQRLPESKYLEHVYAPNAAVRKDHRYLDYVNLSISRLNTEYFGHSTRWHAQENLWWCALGLDPSILEHDGALFTTTNNIYTGCRRGDGPDGLAAMFEPIVERWVGNYARRTPDMPKNWTTCRQAEVLYPAALSVQHLTTVYVATGPHADIAAATCAILLPASQNDVRDPPTVPVIVDPNVFAA